LRAKFGGVDLRDKEEKRQDAKGWLILGLIFALIVVLSLTGVCNISPRVSELPKEDVQYPRDHRYPSETGSPTGGW